MTETANLKAAELKTKLFRLVNEYRDLALALHNASGDVGVRSEAYGQVESAACALAEVYGNLGDLFVDAARDEAEYQIAL